MKKLTGFCTLALAILMAWYLFLSYIVGYLWNEYIADAVGGPHLPFKIVFLIVVVLSLLFSKVSTK